MVKIQHSKYLLLIFPVIVFLFFYYYLNFDGLYGQDAYEYLRYSKAIRNYLITGQNPGDYFWPLFYPIFGALFSFITQKTTISLLLISTLSLSITAYYLSKIINLLFKKTPYNILYIFVFFLLSPIIFKSGLLVMSDILTLQFIVLSIFQFLKFKQTKAFKYFYFFTIFCFAAFMTRYASAVVLLPFVINGTLLFFKQKKWYKHIVFLLLVLFILSLPHLIIRNNNATEFLSHQWLQDWSVVNIFKRNFITVDGASHHKLPNILYALSNIFHPRFFFVGIVFIPFLLNKKFRFNSSKILSSSILLYAIFLAGIPFQNSRFLILSFPLILILCYPVFVFLSDYKYFKKTFYFGIFLIGLMQLFLIHKTFKSTLVRNKLEIEMASLLKPYQNNTLYSFDIDIALQGRNLEFNYKNLWQKRYTNLQNGDLILFHPTKFIKQWQGKNPMLNFNYFKENYTLKVIKELPENWQLYKVITE